MLRSQGSGLAAFQQRAVAAGIAKIVIQVIFTSISSISSKAITYQNYFENGEYFRSAEMDEEQNYNMIDGRINNQKKKPKVTDQKKRKSVLKLLHQKQDELEKRYGKNRRKWRWSAIVSSEKSGSLIQKLGSLAFLRDMKSRKYS